MYYEIYKDGQLINTIVGGAEFVAAYCESNGYTYIEKTYQITEPEPTAIEQLRADVDYIAMETGVEL